MKKLEKLYNQLKATGEVLNAVQKQTEKKLVEFVKAYGKLDINPDGVPHTVMDMSDDDTKQYQIVQLEYNPDKHDLIATTIDGKRLDNFAFDDIGYLIEDLSEECLEYAETGEEPEKPSDCLNYIMVNVPGKYGYSFMVTTKYANMSEQEILNACLANDLFEQETDVEIASIDTDVYEDDIRHFKDCTHNIDEKS